MAEQHPFLSPEWMDAVRRIREEMPAPDVPSVGLMKMNLHVSATPFDGDVKAHVDTSDGELLAASRTTWIAIDRDSPPPSTGIGTLP